MEIENKSAPVGLRSSYCGEITQADIGEKVTVCGWVDHRREHGEKLAFVDLRDHTGVVQCVVDENIRPRSEFVLQITGVVRARPEGTENKDLKTGKVEIGDCNVEILNSSETPPIGVDEWRETDESLRLKYRYLDMRRPAMQKNLRTRAVVNSVIRQTMESQGFLEIETPMLIASTPEGARDFVVPSRLHQGSFYALPQSPQIFKQLAMVGGVDRYYQIARCMRDEDLRADRQFEFMQLDMEASFVGQNEIIQFISKAISGVTEELTGSCPQDFEVITYQESMERFGTDKPDMRFGMELCDMTEVFANTEVKVFQQECIKAIKADAEEASGVSRSVLDDLTKEAQAMGAKGLAWFRVETDGSLQGPLVKNLSENEINEIQARLQTSAGELVLMVSDERRIANLSLGHIRLALSGQSLKNKSSELKYIWVIDFPLFEKINEEGNPVLSHHPFTMPHPEDLDLLKPKADKELLKIRSRAYDLVLNGWELGSGSERIHDPEIQSRLFSCTGISDSEAREKFGFLLEAFKYGAPPHAGFAFGIDRLTAILLGEENIREVIAFPKTQSGIDPLVNAPGPIGEKQMRELGLRLAPANPASKKQ